MTSKKTNYGRSMAILSGLTAALSLGVIALTAKTTNFRIKSQAATPLRSFYVDCATGNDANPGTYSQPWKTLIPVANALKASGTAQPGDYYYLNKACTFTNTALKIEKSGTSTNPIVVTSYPAGTSSSVAKIISMDPSISQATISPIITVSNAAYIQLINLEMSRTIQGYSSNTNYTINKVDRTGIQVEQNSHDVFIQGVWVRGQAVGIRLTCDWNMSGGYTTYKNCSYGTTVKNSYIMDNNVMYRNTSGGDDDTGAQGIDIIGAKNNTIDTNKIENSTARSYDYGTDGSAIEIFGSSGNIIKYLDVKKTDTFTELGNPSDKPGLTFNNTFSFNTYCSGTGKSNFVVTRGGGTYGPVTGTTIESSTAYSSGSDVPVICYPNCTANNLKIKNSIIYSVKKAATYVLDSFENTNNTLVNENKNPNIIPNGSSCNLTDTISGQGRW